MAEASYGGCASEGNPRRQSTRQPEQPAGTAAALATAARTYARALPIVPVRARGLTVEGADGRRYLDCVSGAGTLALGHNHPVVLEAIREVLDSGAPLHALGLPTPVEDAFLAELFRTLPPGLAGDARVRFCGPAETDAVEAAFRLVREATGRTDVLAFTDAGHGLGDGALTARGGLIGVRAPRLPYPQDYRCPFGVGGPHGAELAARWTESVLDGAVGGAAGAAEGGVGASGASGASGAAGAAGMIVEVVQGEGGVVPAPDAWLRRMRQLSADRSIPLIVDETETGVGRTGAFWAVEHSGITPDVMVLSKAIGGSLPLSVLAYREDLGVAEPTAPAGAFRGNQLAMAAGTATLAHVRRHRLAERASLLGARMLARLRALQARFDCVGDVRGRGLMLGVELVDAEFGGGVGASGGVDASGGMGAGGGEGAAACPPLGVGLGVNAARFAPAPSPTAPPCSAAPELAAAVQRECLRRGLIVGLGGPRGNVVRLLPPLTISDEQAEAVLDRLSDAVEAAARNRTSHSERRQAQRCRPHGQHPQQHKPGHQRSGEHAARAG